MTVTAGCAGSNATEQVTIYAQQHIREIHSMLVKSVDRGRRRVAGCRTQAT